ncbi:MAG: hypothetical protein K2W99_07680, partial [Chthoniobacterales bacterium]|nr:hypothetical protein [Chthoniobacterales bacterium]
MKKLPFFFVLSLLVISPWRGNAMVRGGERPVEESEGKGLEKEGVLEYSKKIANEELIANVGVSRDLSSPKEALFKHQGSDFNQEEIGEYSAREEEQELIKNVGESTVPSASVENVLLESKSSEPGSSQVKTPLNSENFDTRENLENEDLSNLEILEQRTQEAQKITDALEKKGTAISEQELHDLYQKWFERSERYQQAQSALLERNNNAGLIQQQVINEPRLEKLKKLVKSSQAAVEMLGKALESCSPNEATRVAQATVENKKHEKINDLILQSAQAALQERAKKVVTAFEEELLPLPRDKEGNILEPSKQAELRPKILRLLKNYEDQRQAWIAQATSQRLAEVEILEEATKPITFQIIDKLDFNTLENEAVFWTGHDKKNIRNQDTAMTYAKWAKSQNKKTIEMTRDGKLLDQLGMYKTDSPIATDGKSKLGDVLFDAASIKFAQGARGKVTAFIYQPDEVYNIAAATTEKEKEEFEKKKLDFEKSAYCRIEQPILWRKKDEGSITLEELPVHPKTTLPLHEKIDKEKKHRDLIGHVAAKELSTETVKFIAALLDKEEKDGTGNITLTNLKILAHWYVASTRKGEPEIANIQEEEKKLFENLHQDSHQLKQRLQNLTELDQTLEKSWAQTKNAFEIAYQEHFKHFQQKEKELQALEEEHKKYQHTHDQLFLEGERLRKQIHSKPELQSELEKNTQELQELNRQADIFQEEYPEKRKVLEEACQQARAVLWNFVIEHASAEEEQQLEQQTSASRLKTAYELLKQNSSLPSQVEEKKEVEELEKLSELYKQTTSGWETLEESTKTLLKKLEHKTIPTKQEYESVINQIETIANQTESISGKDYQSRKAMKGALAIGATARALRQWEQMLRKLSLGNREESDFLPHQETISQAQQKMAENLTKIIPEGLEAISDELHLSAARTRQIAGWSKQLLQRSSQLPRKQSRLSLRAEKIPQDSFIATIPSDDLQETILAIPGLSKTLSDLEEHLGQKQEEHFKNIEKLLLEIRTNLLNKEKELFEEEKKLEERRLTLETREAALEEEKKNLHQEPPTTRLQPLLSNLEQQAESIELQKENTQQQEENILQAEERLLDQRQKIKEIREEENKTTPALLVQNHLLEQEEKKQEAIIIQHRNQRLAKPTKKLPSPLEAFQRAKKEVDKISVEANKTLFEAINDQLPTSWKLAQEATEMTATAWEKTLKQNPENPVLSSVEKIRHDRELPKAKKQQELWSHKAAFATQKHSALESHQQATTEIHDPNLIEFVAEAWKGLLQSHHTLLTNHVNEMANQEKQAWQNEREHLLSKKEKIQNLKQERAKKEKLAQEKEALQKETETMLEQFEELLEDAPTLIFSDPPDWNDYQKKYENFFERVAKLATRQKEHYQGQLQKENAVKLLEFWENITALAQKEEKKHQELKEPTSEKEEKLFYINLFILRNQLQEAMELEKEASPIADLWRESRQLYEQAATAWDQDNEEKAELLNNRARVLGNAGAAYCYQQERRALAQGKTEVAALWNASAKQHQVAADYYRQSMEPTLAENQEKAKHFEIAATAAWYSANKLHNAATALEKASQVESEEKKEVAAFWNTSAKQYQLAADYRLQSMKATLAGDQEQEKRFEIAAGTAENSGWRLNKAARALEKALEAEAQGKEEEVAVLYKKSAEQHQLAAVYWRQSAE